ncbi:MAG: ribonuclease J [Candidatus Promineifilaceae bacterium]|nr:ribonuclease J [Candidatus Promineifilaceae bacterium]
MTDKLRIVPIGGLGEIGKNMTVFEYEDEIIIVDAGIMFPENDMLGIDLIIPDYDYVLERKDKVLAIVITHGHEDHVGALPHVMRDIDAPIYATRLTTGLIRAKLNQAGLLQQVELNTFQAGDVLEFGSFIVEPYHVAHSIPDGVGFGITTPVGLVVHTGDYKFDHTPVDGWPPDFAKLAEFSQRGVLCLLADSTNAERPGWTPSETVITEAFDSLFREAQGRIIVATFASLISRIQQVANASIKHGRKLAVTGRSMRENVATARELGYLDIPGELLIDINQASSLPADKVTIMATGSQGEPTAAIGRLATGRHRQLEIQPGDTVVLSAHPIPGNEEMVYRIINRLLQRGASVYHEGNAEVHVSGHAAREEMKLLINLVRPEFFVPIHGELRHLKAHGRLAEEMGIPAENIAVVENGTILELSRDRLSVGPRVPGGYVFVDGSGVGDVGPAVMRDRERLADSGFFVAVAEIDDQGQMVGRPDFVSRGFIYLDESAELLQGAEEAVARTIRENGRDRDRLRRQIESTLSRYFYHETKRRPMIYAVVR